MIMESSHFFLFFLLILCNLAVSHSFSSSLTKPRCHNDEMYALLQFKDSFVSTNSCFYDLEDTRYPKVETWKGDCCSWNGVECDNQTDHVISLDLSFSCLRGSINSSSSLFSLVHLQKLNLAYNNFQSSQIPSEIAKLSSLTYLNLSRSSFSGEIPSQLSNITTLVSLDLSDNYSLRGRVQQLINLKELHLSYVPISSSLPNLLTKFSSLESLRLDNCELNGEFPMAIFHLPNLKMLDLSDNSDVRGYFPKFHLGSPLKSLVLSSTNFGGELPPSIENLADLEKLDISSCNFTGKLPLSLGNLTQLVSLYLSDNHFTPDSLTTSSLSWIGKLTKLSVLHLDYMNLKGEILSQLLNLTQLFELSVKYNQLTGPIPPSLMNLTQLKYLDFSNNQLSGQIPFQINHLTSLTKLELSSNNLEGSVPTNFSNLNNLNYLSLGDNRFVGSVELSIFLNSKNLYSLILSHNNLSLRTETISSNSTFPYLYVLGLASCNLSEFPKFLHSQKKQLGFLDLSDNKIKGQIPSWICDIGRNSFDLNLSRNLLIGFEQDPICDIRSLDLRYNNLQGSLPIPPSYTAFYLVSNNNLSGEVSPFICNSTSLKTLDLSFNKFTGKLPQCLSYFSDSLSLLDLRRNKFDGDIPSTWTEGCKLKMISMSHNQLQGLLPRSLANCSLLEFVDFGNNKITDSFPFWLGTIPQLSVLILRSNSLHGVINDSGGIGFSNLRVIDLSHNNFRGKLPPKLIDNWNLMKTSNASHKMAYMEKSLTPNMFSVSAYYGSFGYSMTINYKGLEMNYMKIPDIFCATDFSHNNFQGQIPDIIGNLTGLQLLNLSGNFLSGHIPSSFSNMKALECLDLSRNLLSGQIPIQLTKLTSLSKFYVSFNNLSGSIPQGNQFCTFDPESYEGNSGLSVATWTKQCGNFKSVPQPQPPSIAKDEDSESAFNIKWMIISIGFMSGLVVGVIAGNEFTKRKHYWFVKTFGRRQRRKGRRRRRNGN